MSAALPTVSILQDVWLGPESQDDEWLALVNWTRNVAATTFVDFLVETYGRDQLPVLMNAMRHYDTVAGPLTHVFGDDVAEIEQGWQSYLARL